MADVTVKRIDDMEAIWGGSFVRARASLGASAFGMNIWNFPPDWDQYWEHNHVDAPADDHEEEVYTALSGKAALLVGGEEHTTEPGVFARVGAGETRMPDARPVASVAQAPGRAPNTPEPPGQLTPNRARPKPTCGHPTMSRRRIHASSEGKTPVTRQPVRRRGSHEAETPA